MKRVLVAALIGLAGTSFADSEFRHGADWVRITALPCKSDAVKAQIALTGEDPKDFRAASASVAGSLYEGCWKPMMQQEVVVLVYEDGDRGMIPFQSLKPVKTV